MNASTNVASWNWYHAGPLALLLCLASGCSTGIPGNGVAKTEMRAVGAFDQIKSGGIGELDIRFGDQPEVQVTVDENLMEYVTTEVKDGTLVLGLSESINTNLGLKYQITVKDLSDLKISGVGSAHLHEVTGESLKIHLSGVGSVKADGKVTDLDVRVSGVGNAKLKDLIADSVKVKVSGTGGAEVYASKSVDASVSGVGGIEVYGNPETKDKSVSGLGDVTFK